MMVGNDMADSKTPGSNGFDAGLTDWRDIDPAEVNLRLVIVDMDGTLLDERSQLPEGFWAIERALEERGIPFVPASGRQWATLRAMFDPQDIHGERIAYVAENGAIVSRGERLISTSPIDNECIRQIVRRVREHDNMHLVLGAVGNALIESNEAEFAQEYEKYYRKHRLIDDLSDVEALGEQIVKAAVYVDDDAEAAYRDIFSDYADEYQVALSGQHWVDVMSRGVNKGRGVQMLQQELGVGWQETAIFGDYLNDLEMMDKGAWSFAMDNAHPDLKAAARYSAPANTQAGVIQVLRHLLAL